MVYPRYDVEAGLEEAPVPIETERRLASGVPDSMRSSAAAPAVTGLPRFQRVSIDVTPAKTSEEALLDADRRKDEFLAMLAHELRNPLAPIANAAQLLRIEKNESAVRHAAAVIDRQIAHAGTVDVRSAPRDVSEKTK
jgi:signal transduction histidine kinase